MKHLLKITLLASATVAAISVPVSAGNSMAGLRGMFAPQAAVSEFEGRFVQPERQSMSWQQGRAQAPDSYAQPAYHAPSQGYSSPHRTGENNYPRYSSQTSQKHTAQKHYSRFGSQGPKKSKYGNIYDYESGHCGAACASPAPTPRYVSRPVYTRPQATYRQVTQYKCWDGEIVSDYDGCSRETIVQDIPQYRCWDGEVVTDVDGCKRQTITKQVMRSHSSNSVAPLNCPSGTTAQSDGTCMESRTTSLAGYGSSSTYQSGSSSYSSPVTSMPTNCPSGTTAQSDGTCMEGGNSGYSNPYTGSSVEFFGDNTTPDVTPSYGYNSGDNYGLRSYLPIRK